ncbi:MAG: hypothetical protein EOO87_12675 [Pedobacter sp.]|nr:MAG: hypothetical protein EOO87_12675 [Pedobacter sp.]
MKQSIKIAGILAIISVAFSACRNEEKPKEKPVDTVVLKPDTLNTNKLETPLPIFPTMANKIENLIPKDYEIDLEADGDLNNDGVADKVIVLIKTTDTTAIRPTLVLLKQGEAYNVDEISYLVFDPKFREDGFKNYDYEEVSIDSGKLVVTKQATGPAGSIESTFKYIENDLVLTHITTFNMGAGGQTEQKFDLLQGIYEQTDINTMKEDMPSETTTKKYKIPVVLFKDTDPSAIMIEAFRKVGH